MEPILEAAFSYGEHDNSWHARITWKCPVCGRRNRLVKTGPGRMAAALPLEMACKHGHKTLVMPYHWKELQPKSAA
jgi:hypothetical protein